MISLHEWPFCERCGLAGRAKSDVAVTHSFTSTFTRVVQLQLLTTGQYLGPKFAVEVHFGEVEVKLTMQPYITMVTKTMRSKLDENNKAIVICSN